MSLLIGALIGALNVGAALWILHRATRLGPTHGMRLVLAGMGIRMALALAMLALALVFLPVHRIAFVSGLGLLFVVGLAVEILFVLGRDPDRLTAPQAPADA